MVTQILVNIGCGNGLLPDDTKQLPKQIVTYCQLSPMEQTLVKF